MDCPACGAQGLQLGGRCARCGEAAPIVARPPGFMPQKIELTGPQMALVITATFIATILAIFLAFVTNVISLVFTSRNGPIAALLMLAYFMAPGTIAGILLNRRFYAQNLKNAANAQPWPGVTDS